MDTPLATLEQGGCRAEIFEMALPGQFSIRYCNAQGSVLEEENLAGVSSYKQREQEIRAKLHDLCTGGHPASGELADPGEY